MDGVPFQSDEESKTEKTKTNRPIQQTPDSPNPPVASSKLGSNDNPSTFSFQQEVAKVETLMTQFPASRLRLIEYITQADPFKAKNKDVKPHSLSEQMQNKIGAVKVLALRELMKNQKDLKQLSLDLRAVVDSAQDPTIRRIAQAADDSLAQGRSFFDDFLDGLSGMPL